MIQSSDDLRRARINLRLRRSAILVRIPKAHVFLHTPCSQRPARASAIYASGLSDNVHGTSFINNVS